MTSLAGQRAIVTGASRGIGLAIARALSKVGVAVCLVARASETLTRVTRELGGSAREVAADLASGEGRGRMITGVKEFGFDAPDLLVLNAGAFHIGSVGELPLSQADDILAVNLVAPYHLLHHLAPGMRARGTGHIVTLGSVADRSTFPGNGAYAASKFGLRALHHVISDELRGSGIRTTLISPGPVNTEVWDPIKPETRPGFPTRQQMLSPDDVAEAVLWSLTRPPHVVVDELRMHYS
jgi:NADP-dependent 3-hydroxy acid dehydrogenase YdfG